MSSTGDIFLLPIEMLLVQTSSLANQVLLCSQAGFKKNRMVILMFKDSLMNAEI